MKVKVLKIDGSAGKGDIELNDAVFGVEPRADILHRVVTWQLENRRGIARATRERSEVARTGKKLGNQKGGGTARHGDRAAPIFIGGGKAHGARRREFDVSLNKKVRALGLKMALSAKAKAGLVVVDNLELTDAKTKLLVGQLAKSGWGKKVLVIDKRPHTAGNCFDYMHSSGFRVAEYGPHFFHTNSERAWNYVSRFCEWTPYVHRVVARLAAPAAGSPPHSFVHVPVPVNITTVNTLFGAGIADCAGMDAWLAAEQVPVAGGRAPADSREVALSRVGSRLYELLFRGYTRKQWAKWPEELEASVLARIPVRNNFDDRYFTDPHQALPRHGYAAFTAAMLDHPNIEVRTGVDYFAEAAALRGGAEKVFFTGPVDRYFAHLGHAPLEYRTVTFQRAVLPTATAAARLQPASQVNFPDAATPHTRITEYKHLPNQDTPSGLLHTPRSVLMTEFSSGEGEPFYPVPAPANRDLYERYRAAAAGERGVVFVGRLASYKYFNMDQAILAALETADTFLARSPA